MQSVPDIEKTVPEKEFFRLKRTKYKSREKVCVNFKISTDKLIFVVYRYR